MTLPVAFKDSAGYFEDCLLFFSKYQHLYKYPNTDILIVNVLDQIHIDVQNIDTFSPNVDLKKVNSEYLQHFFDKSERLSPAYEEFKDNTTLELVSDAPLSPKKKHEIVYLGHAVSKICDVIKCETIIDFGSGLGYLDQQLFETTPCNILGLECNENHYIGAKKRQRKYHQNSLNKVKFIKHTITENSLSNLKEFVTDKFPNTQRFCITGLHACADLTVDAINLFIKMDEASSLVIMPCCYHRIQSNNSVFKNFPLSNCLKMIYEKFEGSTFLQVPFLRLATQPQILNDCKIEDLVFNLLSRAALQLYAWNHNCIIKRKKRKAIRMKVMGNNFKKYIEDVAEGFTLVHIDSNMSDIPNSELENIVFNHEKLFCIWRQISPLFFAKAAIFIKLQNHLQPIFENFVLYDRLCYLQENGIKNCRFEKILNNKISPRCLSLIAYK